MSVANYSTKISCVRTIGEIQEMLAKHGAQSIYIEFEKTYPVSVSFRMPFGERALSFSLPVNPAATFKRLTDDLSVSHKFCTMDQARRVAWRTVRQWLLAQLEFIENGQVSFVQAMMPYALDEQTGKTVFELFSGRLMLPEEV